MCVCVCVCVQQSKPIEVHVYVSVIVLRRRVSSIRRWLTESSHLQLVIAGLHAILSSCSMLWRKSPFTAASVLAGACVEGCSMGNTVGENFCEFRSFGAIRKSFNGENVHWVWRRPNQWHATVFSHKLRQFSSWKSDFQQFAKGFVHERFPLYSKTLTAKNVMKVRLVLNYCKISLNHEETHNRDFPVSGGDQTAIACL